VTLRQLEPDSCRATIPSGVRRSPHTCELTDKHDGPHLCVVCSMAFTDSRVLSGRAARLAGLGVDARKG
jgi:hypothetical protein